MDFKDWVVEQKRHKVPKEIVSATIIEHKYPLQYQTIVDQIYDSDVATTKYTSKWVTIGAIMLFLAIGSGAFFYYYIGDRDDTNPFISQEQIFRSYRGAYVGMDETSITIASEEKEYTVYHETPRITFTQTLQDGTTVGVDASELQIGRLISIKTVQENGGPIVVRGVSIG